MGESGPVRVLIVDESQLFRECLSAALAREPGFIVIGTTSRLEDARRLAGEDQADVVLAGSGVSRKGAGELAGSLNSDGPRVKVLMLGIDDSEQEILRCVEAGASGYILKDASLSELKDATRAVLRGQTVCSPRITAALFARVAELSAIKREHEQEIELTRRETQILALVANDLSNKEIAQRLYLSLHTVKNHMHHILEKLEVPNRRAAVKLAREQRLFADRPI